MENKVSRKIFYDEQIQSVALPSYQAFCEYLRKHTPQVTPKICWRMKNFIESYLSKLSKISLLILDDFGLRKYSHKEATIFYEILEDRCRKGSVIITSQVKPQAWASLFEDKVIAEAIPDRLVASSQTIDVKGESFRGSQNKKKIDHEEN
jgi:DNA replication protein DnaC